MDVNNIQFTRVEILIVKYLFKHYKDTFNPRQLAKVLHINHAHANKVCNNLLKKKLLEKKELGNAIYFSFQYKNMLSLQFMKYLLDLEDQEFPSWLSVVLHNLKKFSEYITLGIVFGSSIKNEQFNDVDVLLIYKNNKIKEINRIKKEILNSQLIEQPIRYVDITEKDIVRNRNDAAFYSILSDSMIFHNSDKYVEVIQQCRKQITT